MVGNEEVYKCLGRPFTERARLQQKRNAISSRINRYHKLQNLAMSSRLALLLCPAIPETPKCKLVSLSSLPLPPGFPRTQRLQSIALSKQDIHEPANCSLPSIMQNASIVTCRYMQSSLPSQRTTGAARPCSARAAHLELQPPPSRAVLVPFDFVLLGPLPHHSEHGSPAFQLYFGIG